jgi:hypothetical protein
MDTFVKSDLMLGLAALVVLATFLMLAALLFCDRVRDP